MIVVRGRTLYGEKQSHEHAGNFDQGASGNAWRFKRGKKNPNKVGRLPWRTVAAKKIPGIGSQTSGIRPGPALRRFHRSPFPHRLAFAPRRGAGVTEVAGWLLSVLQAERVASASELPGLRPPPPGCRARIGTWPWLHLPTGRTELLAPHSPEGGDARCRLLAGPGTSLFRGGWRKALGTRGGGSAQAGGSDRAQPAEVSPRQTTTPIHYWTGSNRQCE